MSTLRVELFYDDEASNWHYRVPALHSAAAATRRAIVGTLAGYLVQS
jgi:hypothetical protein